MDTPHGEHRQSPGCGSPACDMEGMPRGGEPQEPPDRPARRGESATPPCRRKGFPSLQTLDASGDASVRPRPPIVVLVSRVRAFDSWWLSHEHICTHDTECEFSRCSIRHGPETLTGKVNPDSKIKTMYSCLRGSQPHEIIKKMGAVSPITRKVVNRLIGSIYHGISKTTSWKFSAQEG